MIFDLTNAVFDMRAVRLADCGVDGKYGKQSENYGKVGVIIGVRKQWRGFVKKELQVDVRWADGNKSTHRQGLLEVIA
jgi:hypothetical protein